jgi:hypothetical protein
VIAWLCSVWPKLASGAAILAVAAVAGVISYSHIYELTLSLHQSTLTARLMPVAIDGLITVGSVVLLQSGSPLGWLGVGPGLALSLFANIESGIRYGWLAAVWAGIPALSFFLATFIFEHWLKGQAKTVTAATATPAATPVSATAEVLDVSPEATADTAPETPVKATVKAPETRQPVSRPRDIESDMERKAKRVLKTQPDISGAALGRAIGASPRTGQRLLTRLSEAA